MFFFINDIGATFPKLRRGTCQNEEHGFMLITKIGIEKYHKYTYICMPQAWKVLSRMYGFAV